MSADFRRRGWTRFPVEPMVADWAAHALAPARAALRDPELAQWHVCEGTWFVGVDALPNDALGRVGGSEPLRGAAMDFIARAIGPVKPLHRGQVSVVRPGYPQPRAGESPAAFRFRRDRDAAHVDGLHATGPDRRRMLREAHGFILGLPLSRFDPGAAPLVVWEGSHEIIRRALRDALTGHDPADWAGVDLTAPYAAARREAFETCPRVLIHAGPGEACLLHRLALHGVAPWQEGAEAGPDGRMIAYFRPELTGGVVAWLNDP